MSATAGPETMPVGDFTSWAQYFDELELAMHDFEVALSRRDVEELRAVNLPPGAPPESLKERWLSCYQRISELEFRALALREELRLEFARLNHNTRRQPPDGYGSSIDITG